jgi:biotin carboxyl carrier protein
MEQAKQSLDLTQSQLADCRQAADRFPNEIVRLQALQREANVIGKRRTELAATRKRLAAKRDAARRTERQGSVEQAEAAVRAAEKAVARCQVTAPRAGRLQALKVRPGGKVKVGQVLAEIEVSGGSRMVFRASLADADRVQVGQDVTVEAGGAPALAARVSQVERLGTESKVLMQPLGEAQLAPPGTPLVARIRAGG